VVVSATIHQNAPGRLGEGVQMDEQIVHALPRLDALAQKDVGHADGEGREIVIEGEEVLEALLHVERISEECPRACARCGEENTARVELNCEISQF
jgi:hypothetical protein